MAWLRVDDGLAEHPKVLELPRSDRWTWVELLCYCARQGKDGTIPAGISSSLRYVTPAFVDRCVKAGLVDLDGDARRVHDWEHFNPKDPGAAERQARWRRRHRNDDSNGDVDGESNAPRVAARPRPVPSTSQTPPQPLPGERDDDLDLEPSVLYQDELLEHWRAYAAKVPGVRSVEALAQHGYRSGQAPPENDSKPERRPPDPSKVCDDCGETYGAGHLETCRRILTPLGRTIYPPTTGAQEA